MSCKSKKKCFGNKGMSHIKCYEAVKQEPFELSKGPESQHSVGRTEMETVGTDVLRSLAVKEAESS